MRLLVTGASRGLGAVVARSFENVTTLGRGEHLPTDFQCDAVIHCAGGGYGMRAPLLDKTNWITLLEGNLLNGIEINNIVIPGMKARGLGYIVHICSIASGEAVGSVAYNTVKAALAAYVRSLGREMAPHGVVGSGIAPGAFKSPGNAMERLEKQSPEAYQDFINNRLPRKRMGTAEELIPLLKLLVSPEASMMGGTVIPIDAGEGRYYE